MTKTKIADSEHKSITKQPENNAKKLRYLEFVQVVSIYAIVYCSTLYEYAKENSGPLRPGVQAVERTVKTVIGPVYEKFHGVPFDLLKFVDHKVDASITELNGHVPVLFKQFAIQIRSGAEKAPEFAGELVSDIQHYGLVRTLTNLSKTAYTKYDPVAKELYAKYEPAAEQYAVMTWQTLNRLPLFPQVAHIMVPTAAYWAEKYNGLVCYSADRGYVVSYYLLLVPIERIAKTFEGVDKVPVSSGNGEYIPSHNEFC